MSAQCDDVRERAAAGEEPGAPDLAAHLATCDACRAVLASLVEVDDALGSLTLEAPPPALARAAVERVRTEATDTEASGAAQEVAGVARGEDAAKDAGEPGAVPAGRLAIAALIAALVAVVQAPLALLRWLATPRRAVLTLGATAVGAAGALLFVVAGGERVRSRVSGADAYVGDLPAEEATVAVATPTDRFATLTLEGDGHRDRSLEPLEPGYFGDEVRLATLDEERSAEGGDDDGVVAPSEAGALAWRTTAEVSGEDGRFESAIVERAPAGSEADLQDSRMPAADQTGLERSSPEEAEEETRRGERGRDGWADDGEVMNGVAGERARMDFAQAAEGQTERAGPAPLGADVQRQLDALGYAGASREVGDVGGERREARDPAWLAALERTEGVPLRARRGWWENTYVPGDAALRVLHRRLASSAAESGATIAGGSLSALALAELASPAAPAITVPRDAALALGVQADVRAIEGARRVRVEVGLRAMERAAGRRDPMRVAIVIDARRGLDGDAAAHLREVLAALGRARGARDRVSVYGAGPGGGELLALGELRHGEVEIALRRFLAPRDAAGGEAAMMSLGDALSAAIGSAGGGEGAGLVLLLTPGGALDGASGAALHAGALAGVPTSAIAIDDGAALAELDAIALAGQGRRRSVSSAEEADRAVRGELEAASRIVARALRLELRLGAGVELVDVVGSEPLDAARTARAREAERTVDRELAASLGISSDRSEDDDGLVMYLPAFHAGASHTVLLDLVVRGPGAVLEVDLRYKDLVRLRNGRATGALSLARGRAARGPAELRVVSRLLASEMAAALAASGDRVAAGDPGAARARIELARARILAACDATPGLAAERSVVAELALAERYLAALAGGRTSAELLSASLRYAARRHVVVPDTVTP